MFPPRSEGGLTWLEILVAISVIALLAGLAIPSGGNELRRSEMTRALSNMKQLHLATQQMALDGTTIGDPKLGWPGDTGGTFSNWANQLVPGYLSTNDFCKLMLVNDGVPEGQMPQKNDNGILVYAVKSESPKSTVFLSTANFTNTSTGGIPPKRPFFIWKEKSIVLFRKGDNGAILLHKQAGDTNIIGAFAPLCR